MKLSYKILLSALVIAISVASCIKADQLPLYGNGQPATLTSSTATVAPAPADSNNVAVTFNWTSPKYATDTSKVKYVIEIDSTNRNFSKAVSRTVMGSLSSSFLAKELNSILLGFGFAFNTPYVVDVRVTSSYANNNEAYKSNVIKLNVTPYKIPPKVALPASGKLFIVGNATAGGDATGWNNPVPVPSQEFSRINETTFAGIFQLNAGKTYLLLPVNGSWDTKFGGTGASNNSNNVDGDNFKQGGSDLKAPATSGLFKLVVDFQTGKFVVTPYSGTLASELYIVGNATPGGDATGWNNPVPVPSQQFTRVNSSLFELTIALNANKSYLFLPVNGSWTNKYGGIGASNNSNNVNDDDLKYNGSDMKAPPENATYKISVNFAKGVAAAASARVTVVKQ